MTAPDRPPWTKQNTETTATRQGPAGEDRRGWRCPDESGAGRLRRPPAFRTKERSRVESHLAGLRGVPGAGGVPGGRRPADAPVRAVRHRPRPDPASLSGPRRLASTRPPLGSAAAAWPGHRRVVAVLQFDSPWRRRPPRRSGSPAAVSRAAAADRQREPTGQTPAGGASAPAATAPAPPVVSDGANRSRKSAAVPLGTAMYVTAENCDAFAPQPRVPLASRSGRPLLRGPTRLRRRHRRLAGQRGWNGRAPAVRPVRLAAGDEVLRLGSRASLERRDESGRSRSRSPPADRRLAPGECSNVRAVSRRLVRRRALDDPLRPGRTLPRTRPARRPGLPASAAPQCRPAGEPDDVLARAKQVYTEDGPKPALPVFERALALYRAAGDRRGEAITLGLIGNCYKKFGDHQKALDYLNRALAMKRELGDRLEEGKTLSHLGLRLLGDGRVSRRHRPPHAQHRDRPRARRPAARRLRPQQPEPGLRRAGRLQAVARAVPARAGDLPRHRTSSAARATRSGTSAASTCCSASTARRFATTSRRWPSASA